MTPPPGPAAPAIARARRVLPTSWRPALRVARRAARWNASWVLPRHRDAWPPRPVLADTPVRLLVGPANFAGQGDAWARAAARLDGVSAVSMAVDVGGLSFPADLVVAKAVYRSLAWDRDQRDWVRAHATHVLAEAGRPVTGPLYGENGAREADVLRRAGLKVAMVAHGSELRLPSRHRELYRWSPFDPARPETAQAQELAERAGALLTSYDGPTFVSTPDLLDFAPRARWLPVVVDVDAWASDAPVLERERPVVVHIPTRPWLKGSPLVDGALQDLHEDGVVDYRRLEQVSAETVHREVLHADVVIDQVVLGCYGVMAVQAMAAGRLTLAHVHERNRARVGGDLPVVEVTPDSLVDVIQAVASDRDAFRAGAAAGPAFVRHWHDGRRSAGVLSDFLVAAPAGAAG